MNLWLRMLRLLVASFFRPRLTLPEETSVVPGRVWPHDLDLSMHMNNGRYLTLMDLGRLDLILRGGLLGAVAGKGWVPVLLAAKVRYRREIRLFRPFRIETRILCWTEREIVMDQRIVTDGRDGEPVVNCAALMLTCLYDRAAKAYVPVADILAAAGRADAVSPPVGEEVEAFLAANDALKRATSRPN